MIQPFNSGPDLIAEIDQTIAVTPTLWWLGHAGFVMKFAHITFYIDPCLSDPPGRTRRIAAPLAAHQIRHADMIFTTHGHAGHFDTASVATMLAFSKVAKVALPRSEVEAAHSAGIPYDRMTSTDSGLRIEYFKENLYGRVYSIPSAHPDIGWTQANGHPHLGYLIRFGRWTVYHAGDCAPYPDLVRNLRPFTPAVLLLPIGPGKFSSSQAADLAEEVGAEWVVPMHYGTFDDGAQESEFVSHMLGHRPSQRFHVCQVGEKWTVPED